MEEAVYEITPMNLRHLLEKHWHTPVIFAVINGYVQEKGLSLHQGTVLDTTLIRALN